MAAEPLRVDIDVHGAGWIVLDRPEVHNAFDDALIARLTDELRALEANPAVRAVALAAEGKSFSAGADLNWMRRVAGYGYDDNVADALRLAGLMRTLDRLAKPTVAVVHGPAFGGAVGLIAACDIAVAAEHATFALTEVKLGIIPAAISPYVIRALGPRQARRYILTAERFDAAEAMRLGLVHKVVPAEGVRAAAEDVLATLGGNGPTALGLAKGLVHAVAGRPIDDALIEDTATRIAHARATPEAKERLTAFLEKRAKG